MYINKLTITSKLAPKIVMNKPKQSSAYDIMYQVVNENWKRYNHEKLPQRLVRRIYKEKSIPSYISTNGYIERSSLIKEDPRVYGAKNYFIG